MPDAMTIHRIKRRIGRIFEDGAAVQDAEDRIFLKEHAFPLVSWLAERDRTDLLCALIKDGMLSHGICARALDELHGLSVAFRMLLSYPELCERHTTAPTDYPGALRRWAVELSAHCPPVRARLASMRYEAREELEVPGTDGEVVYYPAGLLPKGFDYAGYVHMITHCLFGHLHRPEDIRREIWDAATDIAAEALMAAIFPEIASKARRCAELPEGVQATNAAAVAACLMELSGGDMCALAQISRRDDHRFRDGAKSDETAGVSPDGGWEGLGAQLMTEAASKKKRYGLAPGSRAEKALLREEAAHDLSRYLRRFSVIREEMQLDTDGFDYVPYCYGLSRYGNMPFIEPPETSELCRVETLAVAIDTSGSCSLETVRRFLNEIRHMLTNRERFFRRMSVHIFQCDSMIQDHRVLHSVEEWQRYAETLTIKGRGGTNFTPVFDAIENLRRKGELPDLKGLLYFTDGDGVYPRSRPAWETAFVFVDEVDEHPGMPEWIIPLRLDDSMR